MTVTCETCRFYSIVHLNGPDQPAAGACLRYPRRLVLCAPRDVRALLTPVESTDWCGEYQPKLLVTGDAA